MKRVVSIIFEHVRTVGLSPPEGRSAVTATTSDHRLYFPLFVLLLLIVISPSRVEAQYFEVVGTIETASYTAPGRTNHNLISFGCVFGANEWRITNSFVRGADRIWQYDGTNVYAITRVTRETTNAQEIARRAGFPIAPIQPQNGDHIPTMTLTESVDGCPLGDVAVNIPWLAYCSGDYISRPGRIIPKPVSTLSRDPEGFAFSDSTVTFQDSLGLPRIVELRTAKAQRSESIRRFHDTHFSSRSPETLETTVKDGVLKFRYSVLQSTNLFGLQIPVSFVYEDYQIEGEGVAVLRYSGAGKVSAIRQTEQPKSPFSREQSYTIVDTRFQDESKKVQAIVYSSNTLATTDDPRLVANFSNWKASVPTTTNVGRNQSRVWAIRSVIFIVVMIPIAMLAFRKWFPQKTKQPEERSP